MVSINPANSADAVASWYGPGFHGKCAAHNVNGKCEIFNENALTAAHKTLPFNTIVEISHTYYKKVGKKKIPITKTVEVRINDRGPYHGNREFDLSRRAAAVIHLSGVSTIHYKILGKTKSSIVVDADDMIFYLHYPQVLMLAEAWEGYEEDSEES